VRCSTSGEPDEVHAVAALAPTGVDENTAVIARYPGGAVGLYHCGLRAGSPQAATIVGTGGIITVGSPFYRPERYTLQRTGAEPETTTATLTGHGFVYEAQEVARCLRAGLPESPVLPLDQTLAVMRTLDAARAETDAGGAAPA
jgi:hypothetical protein